VREKISTSIGMREIKLSAASREDGDIAYPEFRIRAAFETSGRREISRERDISNDTSNETDIASYFFLLFPLFP